LQSSEVKSVDRTPTQVSQEDGTIWNPDTEGRFSIAYGHDGRREYQCDDKPCDLQDFFGATTGKDTIPKKIRSFGGIGAGTMKKAYESEDEYRLRMEKI